MSWERSNSTCAGRNERLKTNVKVTDLEKKVNELKRCKKRTCRVQQGWPMLYTLIPASSTGIWAATESLLSISWSCEAKVKHREDMFKIAGLAGT